MKIVKCPICFNDHQHLGCSICSLCLEWRPADINKYEEEETWKTKKETDW